MEKRDQSQIKEELEENESEALLIIKQDVCTWLNTILDVSIEPETFMDQLDTGVLLCSVAAMIQCAKQIPAPPHPHDEVKLKQIQVPLHEIQCNKKAKHDSFQARDNTANFVAWCRDVGVEETVIFESNGLVMHKDERRVILCLLEVARIAGQVGMVTPKLVDLEKEIDSLEDDHDGGGQDEQKREREREDNIQPKQKRRKRDSLDTKVLTIFNQCKCKNKLHVISHGSGKFEITIPSGRKMIIYVRILSDRILVRVGGGWDSIEHFVLKHDPCRQVTASTLEKNMQMLAPEVKVVGAVLSKKSTRTQRKAKHLSPYSTPSHSSRRNNNNDMKSNSTPSIIQSSIIRSTTTSKKRKLNCNNNN